MTRPLTGTALATTLLCLPLVAFAADPVLPTFDAAAFTAGVANPYVPLDPGYSTTMLGTAEDGTIEKDQATVKGPGPKIMGVATTTVQDDAFAGDRLVERTFDYFATDADGNLWYFGEDVTNYTYDDAGNETGTNTKSSWRAGVDGAVPGVAVPARPVVGDVQFQEHAPANDATDYAEVIAVDAVVTVAGREYRDVLKLFEASTSEPDLREFKYFAKGVGLILAEEELSVARDAPEMVLELQP
ncbi:hypothetical protein [Tabrizicola sp.]|uniref:hypothetical protein n=1 Tax=Tabrizicola sp. TaxID=2005166 RepID=UPI00286C39ED|nr:hypothetical protein [Tabrizicola sp.]